MRTEGRPQTSGHRSLLRSGVGEFGASPKNSPLDSVVYARILGLSQN